MIFQMHKKVKLCRTWYYSETFKPHAWQNIFSSPSTWASHAIRTINRVTIDHILSLYMDWIIWPCVCVCTALSGQSGRVGLSPQQE